MNNVGGTLADAGRFSNLHFDKILDREISRYEGAMI
jgi:hypothetical protein